MTKVDYVVVVDAIGDPKKLQQVQQNRRKI